MFFLVPFPSRSSLRAARILPRHLAGFMRMVLEAAHRVFVLRRNSDVLPSLLSGILSWAMVLPTTETKIPRRIKHCLTAKRRNTFQHRAERLVSGHFYLANNQGDVGDELQRQPKYDLTQYCRLGNMEIWLE